MLWYKKVALLYRGVLYVEVILYSKECNWYTRCCPLNGGVRYRECPLREATLYICSRGTRPPPTHHTR